MEEGLGGRRRLSVLGFLMAFFVGLRWWIRMVLGGWFCFLDVLRLDACRDARPPEGLFGCQKSFGRAGLRFLVFLTERQGWPLRTGRTLTL